VLIATAAVGLGNVVYKYGLRAATTPASIIAAQACLVSVLSTGFTFAIDRRIRPTRPALRFAPFSGILLGLGFVCMVEALARGDASTMVPIAQMGLAVTAIAGFLVLGEAITARKCAGLLAALAALACFAWG
jgi:uncharacterized membrane protein